MTKIQTILNQIIALLKKGKIMVIQKDGIKCECRGLHFVLDMDIVPIYSLSDLDWAKLIILFPKGVFRTTWFVTIQLVFNHIIKIIIFI